MSLPRLAIIGSGISGLGCAHFLKRHFDLTIFEAADYIGGHTNTVTVTEDGHELPIDTGFMVFNHDTYPLLCRLFDELGVETKKTEMSFSMSHLPSDYEWNGGGLAKVFGQRKNVLSPRFWRFVLQINRFNKHCLAAMDDPRFERMTLGKFARECGYGQDFLDLYVVPMGSAVWSTPPDRMLEFPARTLMHFWFNHGFLGMHTRKQWWTVCDGSRQYVRKITPPFADRLRLNAPVVKIERRDGKVIVQPREGPAEVFDKVILATHTPTSMRMLADPTTLEQTILSPFQYQPNVATLHTDERFMPRTRRCWASWNYRIEKDAAGKVEPSTHYWMNNLQGVSDKRNYFVSINGEDQIDPAKVLRRIDYEHPLFDLPAIEAQKRLPELRAASEQTHTLFCGAWGRYGFHEDGFMSAVDTCTHLLGGDPWTRR
jgi:predicted NAD/FAD-binding protein